MQSKPHGQNCPFSLGAGRDWVNTRQSISLKLLGWWSSLEARGSAWSWMAPMSCLPLQRARQTSEHVPKSNSAKPPPAPLPFSSVHLSRLQLRVGCSHPPVSPCPPVPGQGHSTAGTAWSNGPDEFCASASAPLSDLAYLAMECLLLQKFMKSLLFKRLPVPGATRPHLWQDPVLAMWHKQPLVEAVLSLQSLSTPQPPPEAPWHESFPKRSWKVETEHTRFLEFSIPISRSFSQFLALDLQSFMRHIFILSMR